MKLLIEGYPYPVDLIKDFFPNVDELDVVDGVASINYVGYYYHAAKNQAVFILPKVVLDNKDDKVFGNYKPEEIINLNDNGSPLSNAEREFIYGLSVWIYRAIAVFRHQKKDSTIIRHQNIIKVGRGKQRLSNTYLDIILSLIDFNKQNQDWFMFILKNIHSGFNKINWNRTIAKSQVVVQNNEPIYINPVTKKRQVNFDEELLVIFFSILNYIKATYGFPVKLNVNYDLITGRRFERYMPHKRPDGTDDKGFGVRRLRQIKYKYFSDKALQLWDLCYAFFDQSRQVKINSQLNEFLLAKNFDRVFEAIIDNLIGDTTFPDRLNKVQEDGKEVDHMFLWDSLTSVEQKDKVYYIGDSKYYKQHNEIGRESIAKQYTYARNVIQWNLNLFFGEDVDDKPLETDFCLRDEKTEGYNIIPNFFISATIPDDLSYSDTIDETKRRAKTHVSRQFPNRLFDRDTLLITHYDVNFLYIVQLYGRDNANQKKEWRKKVRNIFRDKIQDELISRYNFFAMRAKPGVNDREYIETHFRDILGKVFAPYDNDKGILALALDNRTEFEEENKALKKQLSEAFDIVECSIKQDARKILPPQNPANIVANYAAHECVFLTCLVRKEEIGEDINKNITKLYQLFRNHEAENATYVMLNMPKGDISQVKYLLPLVNNNIEGYYDIEKLSFGTYTKKFKSGELIPGFPSLRIKIGKFHPLEHRCSIGIVPQMANQIWSQAYLDDLLNKPKGYQIETDSASTAQEPESGYGQAQVSQSDYIEYI
jgi:hypothetical protein